MPEAQGYEEESNHDDSGQSSGNQEQPPVQASGSSTYYQVVTLRVEVGKKGIYISFKHQGRPFRTLAEDWVRAYDEFNRECFQWHSNQANTDFRAYNCQVGLEMLAKIAVLVDYYDSPEVVEVFANIWIDALKDKLSTQYGRDMVLWLLISYVFQQEDIFLQMTKIAVTQSTEPVPTLELPIPSIVTDLIDLQRQEAVEFILKTLQTLLEAF
ncbi:hypothetical protein CSHISOI_01678, partial [Colletotrichum shisoi]